MFNILLAITKELKTFSTYCSGLRIVLLGALQNQPRWDSADPRSEYVQDSFIQKRARRDERPYPQGKS